jgi:hypothetical protein
MEYKEQYNDAMRTLADLSDKPMFEIPGVEANIHDPQVRSALQAYVEASVAMRKADIAFAPVANAFYVHSKWHENWHENQYLTEYRTFKHAFDTATENLEEACNALMDSLNMDFTG